MCNIYNLNEVLPCTGFIRGLTCSTQTAFSGCCCSVGSKIIVKSSDFMTCGNTTYLANLLNKGSHPKSLKHRQIPLAKRLFLLHILQPFQLPDIGWKFLLHN